MKEQQTGMSVLGARDRGTKKPGVPVRAAGLLKLAYLEDIGAGAILAGAAFGQHEAARREAAAATITSLTVFMLILGGLFRLRPA